MALMPGSGVTRALLHNMGHPTFGVSGDDELVAGLVRRGVPFPMARNFVARRRPNGGGGQGFRPFGRCAPPPEEDVGFDDDGLGLYDLGADDSIDGADEAELGAIDDEIGALADDDDDDVGADSSKEEIGASLAKTKQKISELEALRNRLEAKLAATPARRRAKRKHLAQRLDHVNKLIAQKKKKAGRKTERLAAKLGIPAAALAAGGGAAAALGISRGDIARAEGDMAVHEALAAQGIFGVYGKTKLPGEEEYLSFLSAGSPSVLVTKAIGGAGSVSVTLATAGIQYADFRVLGIAIDATIQPGAAIDVLPTITVDNWGVSGGINQVYGSLPIQFGANGQMSTVAGGPIQTSRRYTSMRAPADLVRTNTATLTLTFNQAIANAAAINITINAALIVKKLRDDSVPNLVAA